MLRRGLKFAGIVTLLGVAAFGQEARIGKPASEDKIKAMDITVFPDGRGLPAGSGTAAKGKDIFKAKCAVCHNDQAQGREGQYPALVGGKGTLNTPKPVKTWAAIGRMRLRCSTTFGGRCLTISRVRCRRMRFIRWSGLC